MRDAERAFPRHDSQILSTIDYQSFMDTDYSVSAERFWFSNRLPSVNTRYVV